jgi:hypothetical protein
MDTAVIHLHQNNASAILSTLLSAWFSGKLSTKAVPGDVNALTHAFFPFVPAISLNTRSLPL